MWKCFTIRIITSIKLNYVWIDLCMFVAGRVICLLFCAKIKICIDKNRKSYYYNVIIIIQKKKGEGKC